MLAVALLIETAFNSAFPLVLKFLIDDALLARSERMLFLILMVLAASGLFVSVVGVLYEWSYARVSADVLRDLRQRLFEHLQTLSLSFYARARTGAILARFSGDVVAIENAVTTLLPSGLLPLMEVLVSAILLFALNWQLALVAIVVWPLALLGPRWFSRRALAASYRKKQEEAAVLAVTQETIAAQPVIKAFNLQRLAGNWFGERNRRLHRTTCHVNFSSAMVERSAGIAVLALHCCVVGAGGLLAYHGRMTLGKLVAFEAVFLALSYSVTYVTQFVPTLVQAAGAVRHINQLLAEQSGIFDAATATAIPRLTHAIEFRDISFSYAGAQKQLHGINLRIPCAAHVAFVGPSGAGKSTLANLLLRFYDPTDGAVLVDGQDLRFVAQDSWRRQVAIVFQENVLFNMSLRENIRLGRPDATDAEVEAAARATEIHAFIESLPRGYDTSAGERGGQLSGGQRQRVAIARALLRDPALLILDEATSGLDHVTEAAIATTIDRIAGERTVISITHRLRSVMRADVLFVLDAGRLAESGGHAQLLNSGGLYARLWRAQHADDSLNTERSSRRAGQATSLATALEPVRSSL